MTAAAFINQSYEDSDGVAGVLVSNNAEPFALVDTDYLFVSVDDETPQNIVFDVGSHSRITSALAETYTLAHGQTLDVKIDGGAANTVTFDSANFADITNATAAEVVGELLSQLPGSAFALALAGRVIIGSVTKGSGSLIDVSGGTAAAAFNFPAGVAGVDYFADIGAATAAEVVARINAQLDGATASDSAGQIRLDTDRLGDDACVEVLGGTAAPAFLFPAGAECGQSDPGTAQGWTVTSLASLFEFAEWGVLGEPFPSAFEEFTLGWPSSPGAEDDATAIDFNTFVQMLFAGNALAEIFYWFGDKDDLGALTAAGFNSALTATSYEGFDQGWPTVPGSEADGATLVGLTLASFDVGVPETVEDFDEEWKGNEADGTTLVGLTLMVVGQGGTSETFEPFTAVHTVVEVFQATAGNVYEIAINGDPCVYVAQGGDVVGDVANELAACINNSPGQVSATANGAQVEITNLNASTTPFVVGATGTLPSQIGKVYTGVVNPNTKWGGAEANVCL